MVDLVIMNQKNGFYNSLLFSKDTYTDSTSKRLYNPITFLTKINYRL